MTRSCYSDDCENIELYRGMVERSINGKRGQAFLRELAVVLDAMKVKELIAGDLIDCDGACCTIGVVCKARGLDVSRIDCGEPDEVGAAVGISRSMAAEIEYMNDEWHRNETTSQRWVRMRKWVENNQND